MDTIQLKPAQQKLIFHREKLENSTSAIKHYLNCGLNNFELSIKNVEASLDEEKLFKIFIEGIKSQKMSINSEKQLKLTTLSFIKTINALKKIKPDFLGVEMTEESSIYYRIKKNEFSLHVETSFYFEENEDDLVVSLFKNDEIYLNAAGSISEVMPKIYSCIFPKETINFFNNGISK